ncbi:MAG: tRNA guanosine(34) transglycosylase Tgt, partial [Candidatus Paceibacterota bacterium]
TPGQFADVGIQTMLANTYHLYLQPGSEVVRDAGGLHSFMNYDGPTWTDSGGFQVFSLGAAFGKGISKFSKGDESSEEGITPYNKELATEHGKLAIVDDEGVTFTSHIDGSMHRFTAERSIEIQHDIGADIIFSFDECTAPTEDWDYQKEAMERTHRWAQRGLKTHRRNVEMNRRQGLFGIVQGGRFEDLRRESAEVLATMDFDGYGIGGSFSKKDLDIAIEVVNDVLPDEKPRHLLGIGEPQDLFVGVAEGIDTFDCVLPTRLGRTGALYTNEGKVNITAARYKEDHTPLAEWSGYFEGTTYTRSYLAHLFRANEMLGPILASAHNIWFITNLMKKIRLSIEEGRFDEFRREWTERYSSDAR